MMLPEQLHGTPAASSEGASAGQIAARPEAEGVLHGATNNLKCFPPSIARRGRTTRASLQKGVMPWVFCAST